jgi:hypothetical protein
MKINNIYHDEEKHWDGWDDDQLWESINKALNRKAAKRRMFIYLPVAVLMATIGLYFILMQPGNTYNINELSKTDAEISVAHDPTDTVQQKFFENQYTEIDRPSELSTDNGDSEKKLYNLPLVLNSTGVAKSDFSGPGIYSKYQPDSISGIHDYSNKNGQNEQSFEPYSTEKSRLQSPNKSLETRTNHFMPVDFLEKKFFTLIFFTDNIEKLNPAILHLDYERKKHRSSRWDIALSSGFGTGNKSNRYDESVSWQAMKNKNEKYLFSSSSSLFLKSYLSSNIYILSGIDYQRHVSNLKGVNSTIEQETIISDSARIQKIDGVNYFHKGKLQKTITINENFNVYNTLSSVYFPLKLGYQITKGKSLFAIDMGTQILLFSNSAGYSYDLDGKIKSLQSIESKVSYPTLRITDIIGGISYHRRFARHWNTSISIHAQAPIRYSTNQNLFETRYSLYFARLGLSYNIF